MGKVKIKRKSTLIDMTAMSDVTVLLLTFFMLTSTFLQKEPTIVYTPSSVSEEKYNKLHPKNTVTLNADQVNAFKKTNMLGVPFQALPQVLSMETSKRDKFLGELTNPNVGIPINGNKDKNGALNEFQIWMWALANVAQDGRNDKIGQLDAEGKNGAEAVRDADILYNSVFQGRAISVKADKDTPFTTIHRVFDNLQTMGLNKFTLMTALKSESAE